MKTRIYNFIFLTMFVVMLNGCGIFRTVAVRDVVLLPEDRIFTVPRGQKISVTLDGKPLEMTFPNDMKLVSPTVLVRQEEQLNNALLDKVKAREDRNKWIMIITSIFSVISGIFAYLLKRKNRLKNNSV